MATSNSTARRHGSGSAPPLEALTSADPELHLVEADPHAWLLAHPCECEALCHCEDAE